MARVYEGSNSGTEIVRNTTFFSGSNSLREESSANRGSDHPGLLEVLCSWDEGSSWGELQRAGEGLAGPEGNPSFPSTSLRRAWPVQRRHNSARAGAAPKRRRGDLRGTLSPQQFGVHRHLRGWTVSCGRGTRRGRGNLRFRARLRGSEERFRIRN